MKRALLIILACAMLFVLVACKDADVPKGMKRASSDSVPYSLFVPEAWIIDTADSFNTKAHVSSTDTSSVVVSQHKKSDGVITDIDSWWANYKSNMTIKSFTVIEEGVKGVVDNKASKSYLYSTTINEITYKHYVTAIDYNGEIFVIMFTASEGPLYDKTITVVKDEILANFRFK